jgi:hypothetical protein
VGLPRSYAPEQRLNLPGRHRISSPPSRLNIAGAAGTVVAAAVAAIFFAASTTPEPLGTSADLHRSGIHRTAQPGAQRAGASSGSAQANRAAELAHGAARLRAERERAAYLRKLRHRAARERAARERATQQATPAQQPAAPTTTPSSSGSSSEPSGSPQHIAMAMLSSYGWSSSQFTCLNELWTRESGWDPTAENPTSGAYGIPQALPGSKMASAGPDWQSNATTQIKWGLGYIKSLYGSPCGAWAHEESDGWY